jgi:hypothetical protein
VAEVGREDDAEDELKRGFVEAVGDMRQAPAVRVRQGQAAESRNQQQVDRADHQRRGDRGVDRSAPQVQQLDREQRGHPGDGRRAGRVLQRHRDADVVGLQEQHADADNAGAEHDRAGPAEQIADDAADVGAATAHQPRAGQRVGHERDRQHVQQPERGKHRDPWQRTDQRDGDRQRQDRRADGLGQRERVGGPERRQPVDAVGERGPRPAPSLARRPRGAVDRLQRHAVELCMRGREIGVVEPECRSQARYICAREAVLLAEPVGERRPHAVGAGDELGPGGRVALEVLDRGVQRRLAADRERLEKVEPPIAVAVRVGEALHRRARRGNELRRPRLDQEQELRGPARRRPLEDPRAAEELGSGVVGHFRRRCAL